MLPLSLPYFCIHVPMIPEPYSRGRERKRGLLDAAEATEHEEVRSKIQAAIKEYEELLFLFLRNGN